MSRPRDPLQMARRHPRALVAIVAASAVVILGSTVAYSARVDAETRAELRARIGVLTAELAWVDERRAGADAASEAGETCVAEQAALLQPAVDAASRFSAELVARSGATVRMAAAYVAPAAEASASPVTEVVTLIATPQEAAGVDELEATLAATRDLRAEAGAAVVQAELTARQRDAACDAARAAVASAIAEVAPHTDGVIAGNGMASPETLAELNAARDAVLATAADGTGASAFPRWLAAASAVEDSHRVAHEAAIAAAAAAAEAAAERAAVHTLRKREFRPLTLEEMCAQAGFCGFPPPPIVEIVPVTPMPPEPVPYMPEPDPWF